MKRKFSKALAILLCITMMLSTVVIGVSADTATSSSGHLEFTSKDSSLYTKSAAVTIDEENVRLGEASIHMPTPSAGTTITVSRSFTAANYSNADYLSVWIYIPQATLDAFNNATSAGLTELYFEFSSGGGYSSECVRYLYRGTKTQTHSLGKTITTAGWNKIKLPKNFTISSGNSVYKDNVWCGYGSGQTNYYTNWSAINFIRVCYKTNVAGAYIKIGGIGFGFDTEVDGKYAGDDLAAAISNAADGATVKLNNSFTLSSAIDVTKNVTVDFNGYNITSTADYAFNVTGDGLLTLKDESVLDSKHLNYGEGNAKVAVANGNYVCSHRFDTGLLEAADCNKTGIRWNDCRLCGFYEEVVEPITHHGEPVEGVAPTCLSAGNIEHFICSFCRKTFSDEACKNEIAADSVVLDKLSENYIKETDTAITYTGDFTVIKNIKKAHDKDSIRASKYGSTAKFSFVGESFAIIGYKNNTYGMISVIVDGQKEEIVDLYNDTAVYGEVLYEKNVGEGLHEVIVTVLDKKRAEAKNPTLFYACFDRFVTDGEFVANDMIIDPISKKVSDNVSDIIIDIPYVVGGESASLTADALYGTVEVKDSKTLTYTASAVTANDVITYKINGFTGTIELDLSSVSFQAEDMPLPKGFGVTNSWYLEGGAGVMATVAGREFTFDVNAAAIRFIGYRSKAYGSFEVYVDGKLTKVMNEYAAGGYQYKQDLGMISLGEYGKHTVKIKALGRILLDSIMISKYENFFAPTLAPSERGDFLYDVTYATMIDRITEYGYAPTSITGAYNGMFPRDSAYQMLAHIADDDAEAAKALIEYLIAFHKQSGQEHIIHIMNDISADVEYTSAGVEADPGVRYQESCGTGLYGINAGAATPNGAAQFFTPEEDVNIAYIDLVLSTAATAGYFELRVTEGFDGTELANARMDITAAFTSATWKRFELSQEITMKAGTEYAIHIRCYNNGNARTVAWGTTTLTNFESYAYDIETRKPQTMAYRLLTMAEAGDDTAIRNQTEYPTGLYGINASASAGAAQYFIPMRDTTVAQIDLALSTAASTGYFEMEVRENAYNGTLVASKKVDITAAFTAAKWVSFKLDQAITLTQDKKYAIVIRCYDNGGVRTVAWGKTSTVTFPSYAIDVAAEKPYSMAYKILTPADIGETGYFQVDAIRNGITKTYALGNAGKGDHVYQFNFYASYNGKTSGSLYADLYKGSTLIKSVDVASKLTAEQKKISAVFGLSVGDVPTSGSWTVKLRAVGFDSTGVTLYGDNDGVSWTADASIPTPLSTKIQVDANYIFVKAYANFANLYFDEYQQFIEKTFDTVMGYSEYFLNNSIYYDPSYGIVRNVCLEHGREGRYWDCYDLLTNVFASQANYELSFVANRLGRVTDGERLMGHATSIADAIHKELTCTINGKKIYTEMIAIDEDYALYKGFSFVTFAPIAADWFAMDDTIFDNTYEEYMKLGIVDFKGYDILSSYVTLNADDSFNNKQSYITGKALGWELLYCYQTGRLARAQHLLDFIDAFSSDGGFDEGYFSDGRLRDTANQEHASVLLATYALVTGKNNKLQYLTDVKDNGYTTPEGVLDPVFESDLNIGSYNIGNGKYVSYDFQKIADDILAKNLDIVGLQEVDRLANRSGNVDTLKKLSELTGYKYYYYTKTINIAGTSGNNGEYGIGVLSKYPITLSSSTMLESGSYEQRAVQHCQIEYKGATINLFNTHLDWNSITVRSQQISQINNLVTGYDNVVVTGDFNVSDISELDAFTNLSLSNNAEDLLITYPSANEYAYLDNVLYSSEFTKVGHLTGPVGHSDHKLYISYLNVKPTYNNTIEKLIAENGTLTQDQMEAEFTPLVYNATDGTALNYCLYVPSDYNPNKSYPLVTFLHGAGQRGSNNNSQMDHMLLEYFNQSNFLMANSIVIAPQCPSGQQWVDTPWANGNYSISSVAESNELKAVVELINSVNSKYSTDSGRQYITGLSMGGFGTWDLIMRHTDMFTAAVPACGGADVTKAAALKDFPIFTVHGDADPTVPVAGTRAMVNAIKAAGGTKITYIELAGYGHGVWDYTAAESGALEWMFSQSK
ncbi:MAG: endonuclease/exonuclease/phosphatase family protein [Clostridia bacterium]|nr:endonuclease/exonuclease/phosphatase family protein [Clostridia bacterium]